MTAACAACPPWMRPLGPGQQPTEHGTLRLIPQLRKSRAAGPPVNGLPSPRRFWGHRSSSYTSEFRRSLCQMRCRSRAQSSATMFQRFVLAWDWDCPLPTAALWHPSQRPRHPQCPTHRAEGWCLLALPDGVQEHLCCPQDPCHSGQPDELVSLCPHDGRRPVAQR